MRVSIIASLLACVLLVVAQESEQIHGIGGFIRVSADLSKAFGTAKKMDYSQIRVKLVTPEGVNKYSTEVAPTNGYYFLPTSSEDKGRHFLLKVDGPQGWSFEPAEAHVHVGAQGQCESPQAKEGGDINFHFTGFAITGSVVGENCKGTSGQGTEGVTVTISPDSSSSAPLSTVQTDSKGVYTFNNIFPGKYLIQATHPSWAFSKHQATVSLDWENARVSEPLIVSGYDISGRVVSKNEDKHSSSDPVSGVHFILYSDTPKDIKCHPVTIKPTENIKGFPLCSTVSDITGLFQFINIPCGVYTLVPVYRGSDTTFDVSPSTKQIEVTQGSVVVQEPFRVTGFSVTGKVVDFNNAGIPQVSIKANGVHKTVTDSTGHYKLDGLKSGQYTIEASKGELAFQKLEKHHIAPNVGLPNIAVESVPVCGRVVLTKDLSGADLSTPRNIYLRSADGTSDQTKTDKDGKFCFRTKSGKHKISVENSAKISLVPEVFEANIESISAIPEVMFVQSRIAISGKVTCLEASCDPDITVTLSHKSGSSSPASVNVSPNGSFQFREILAGKYTVSVSKDSWCFDNSEITIDASTEDISNLHFKQTGYKMSTLESHDVTIEAKGPGQATEKFTLKKPSDSYCFKKKGIYELVPQSCVRFERKSYSFDTSNPRTLEFNAVAFEVKGSIKIESNETVDLSMEVVDNGQVGKAEVRALGLANYYEFSYDAKVSHQLQFIPRSTYLFYPESHHFTLSTAECADMGAMFVGRPGLYIRGKVEPALEDVIIRVKTSNHQSTVDNTVFKTTKDGKYEIGPLYDHTTYSIEASKEGYNFSEAVNGEIKAFKLGKMSVNVGVAKVLLSISGDNYRSNHYTNSNGSLNVYGLIPGQYFIRPLLKEYSFEPSSTTIEVTEEKDTHVAFHAKRTAFSCYGSVASLNGDPESHVTIEAIDVNNSADREETQSDNLGQFRIRGLSPNKKYQISVKGHGHNEVTSGLIERASPKSSTIDVKDSDVNGIEFIVFHKFNSFEISGTIDTPKEFLSSLEVSLYLEDEPKNPIQSYPLGVSNYFEFSNLSPSFYIVRLHSNLSTMIYSNVTSEQVVDLSKEGTSSKHVVLHFRPQINHDQHEVTTLPFFLIAFTIAIIMAIYSYPKMFMNTLQSLLNGTLFKRPDVRMADPSMDSWIPKGLVRSARSPKNTRSNK